MITDFVSGGKLFIVNATLYGLRKKIDLLESLSCGDSVEGIDCL